MMKASSQSDLLIFGGALTAAVLLLGLLGVLMHRRNAPGTRWLTTLPLLRSRFLSHVLETGIILLALCASLAGPLISWELWHGEQGTLQGFWNPLGGLTLGTRGFWAMVREAVPAAVGLSVWMGVLVLLPRYVRRRMVYLLAATGWLALGFWLLWQKEIGPFYADLREAEIPEALWDPGLMLGSTFGVPRLLTWMLLTFLCGIYMVRRRFSYLRFLLGCFLGDLLAFWFLYPLWAWAAPLAISYLFPVCCVVLVVLPLQRKGFEQLLGISLSKDGEKPVAVPQPLGTAFAHGLMVVCLGFVVFSAMVNYFEWGQRRRLLEGPKPVYRSPALRNAYDDLERYFLKDGSPSVVAVVGSRSESSEAYRLLTNRDRETTESLWRDISVEKLRREFADAEPFLSAYQTASRADYLDMPGVQALSFLNLREISRMLEVRALLAVRENRPDDAFQDMESVLRIGILLKDDSRLIGQMIGAALRSIATDTAYRILASHRDDPVILEALARRLEENGAGARTALNVASLRLGELSWDEDIIPHAPSIVPAMRRALFNAVLGWANYDLIRIGTALERHRLRTGYYPERLDDLVPVELKKLPSDPFVGAPFVYSVTPDGGAALHVDPGFVRGQVKPPNNHPEFVTFPLPQKESQAEKAQ